jgi:outer membrane protein insertion porin family
MRRSRGLAAAALALALSPGPGWAQSPGAELVEQVEIGGNRFLQAETYLFYISTKPGDRYDLVRLRQDFRRLWDTGFLEDLALDVSAGRRGGVIVRFNVRERKRIQIVDYRGSKALKTSDIEDKLKELDAQLRLDSFYDINKAKKVEAIIERLLHEKGHPFGEAKHDAKVLGGTGLQISFSIEDGPKAKVKTIEFVGNEVFSDGKLRGQMEEIKQAGFWNLAWLSGKTKFTEEKWETDAGHVRDFYLGEGYVEASVGKPTLTYTDGKSGLFKKSPVKWVTVTIPVDEGDRYRVGEVEFEGLTVFREEAIRGLFGLEKGDYYDDSRVTKAFEKLQELYGAQGYFQFTGYTERNPDPESKVVDLVIHMEEDERYYVGTISFTGNDTTRDKVIRREVWLNEGDVFNTELLKASIRRVNQLGYFKPMENIPGLTPSDLGENKLDVTFEVEEQNRNQFTFGGGVSGLEGTFINASFSTQNFLGKGETMSLALQTGARTKTYQLAITEPYFLDRPITAGFDVFKRKLEYRTFVAEGIAGYIDDRVGLRLITGMPLGRWGRVFFNYGYEIIDVDVTDTEGTSQDLFDFTAGQVIPTNPFFQPVDRQTESKFTPSLSWNTVNDPYFPSAGVRYTGTLGLAGGPLGGTLNYMRPNLEAIVYLPHTSRTSLGLRAEAAWIFPYGQTADINPETGRNDLPFYQRYFLGGENQIRGYNIRSVGPRDENGFLKGGNKFVLFNAEYYINVGGPLRFLLFFDAGQTFAEEQSINFKDLRTSTGAELRFIMPVLNVPFRLIYAFNPHRDSFQPAKTFKFAVGTTF